ncbi:cbb3-type cytochrome c oxidase subunit 3 [bacterium]|nr:cbb3-type cytochrome c oxidase subunit 3 [bacterium]
MASSVVGTIATVVLFVAFIGLCIWAFSPGQKRRWQESAELPFLGDDDKPSDPSSPERRRS